MSDMEETRSGSGGDGPTGDLLDDLTVSHAFLNALRSGYQGLYVFENVRGRLGNEEARERLRRVAEVLDAIALWWQGFERHEPLLRPSAREGDLPEDGARAWHLLNVLEDRIRALAIELGENSDVEALIADDEALVIRVAACCEAAHSRKHYVDGLIAYGEVMGRPEVADRYRQQLLSCQRQISEAGVVLQRVEDARDDLGSDVVADVLDETLVLSALFGQRIIDIKQIFSFHTGRLDFADLGIEEAAARKWTGAGFAPYEAGLWSVSGFDAEAARAWIAAGVPEALAAAGFQWRGIPPEDAAAWYEAGFTGRRAASWYRAGVDPDTARRRETGPDRSA